MTDTTENRVFGKKREPHVLILARGDKVRHLTIRPWMSALAGCTIGFLSLGYLGATGYLILRDDLIAQPWRARRASRTITKTASQR